MTSEILLKNILAAVSNSGRTMKELWPGIRRALFFSLADDALAFRKGACLSIEDTRLVALRGSRRLGRTKIEDAREYRFEGAGRPPAEKLAAAIALALRELGPEAGGFTLVIPRQWAIVTVAQFPATLRDTLPSAVEFELDRITPLSPAGAYYDFQIIEDKGGRLEVLVAAAPASILEPLLAELRKSGTMPGRIAVRPSTLGTCLGFIERKQSSIFLEGSGDRYSGIEIGQGRIRRLFSGSRETLAVDLKGAVGSGKASLYVKDNDTIAQSLEKAGLPFRSAERIENGPRLKKGIRMPEAAALGGLLEALGPADSGLDLLTRGSRARRSLPLAATLVVLAALLAAAVLSAASPLYRDMRTTQEIYTRIQALKDDVAKVEALRRESEALEKEISFIEDFKGKSPLAIDLLKEVSAVLPKKAWLMRLRIAGNSLDMEGQAPSATELISVLEASKLLKKVEFASPTLRDMRSNADRFALKMEIENADENASDKKQ